MTHKRQEITHGILMCLSLLTAGCQQEMAQQPSYRPLEPTDFFDDGRASRPLVEGTVPRGLPIAESAILTYRKSLALGTADYVDICPIPIDNKALERGRERFNIYCAVCHDALGTGNGKIVERGYLSPPNYHTDYSRGFERRGIKVLLRDVPVGYYFEVISRGYGGMPDYAGQIPPDDRWKIIAYVRALQLSQWAPLKELSEDLQNKARKELPIGEERP